MTSQSLRLAKAFLKSKAQMETRILGGDDFDEKIVDWLAEEFRNENNIDLRQDPMSLQRLREAAEKAKCELSTALQSEINLPFITADASGPKHLNLTLTRAKLEQLTADLIDRAIKPCRQALADAELRASDIDEVVLVGGQTRMPKVQEAVQQFFGKEPHKGVNPDEVGRHRGSNPRWCLIRR